MHVEGSIFNLLNTLKVKWKSFSSDFFQKTINSKIFKSFVRVKKRVYSRLLKFYRVEIVKRSQMWLKVYRVSVKTASEDIHFWTRKTVDWFQFSFPRMLVLFTIIYFFFFGPMYIVKELAMDFFSIFTWDYPDKGSLDVAGFFIYILNPFNYKDFFIRENAVEFINKLFDLFWLVTSMDFLKTHSLIILIFTILISFSAHFFSYTIFDKKIYNRTLILLGIIWLESLILFLAVTDNVFISIGDVNFTSHVPYFFFFDNDSLFQVFSITVDRSLGVDVLSAFFILLTTFLFFFSFLSISIKNSLYLFVCFFYALLFLLVLLFSVVDLFLFYIIFEIIIIPMFFIIGFWGAREERISAAYYFFFFTLVGSLIMLLAIIHVYLLTGSLNYLFLSEFAFDYKTQLILWPAFFLAFGIKLPIFPLHIWLPKAHGEAPTIGSVLLAGILLKLGGYGLIKFTLNFFPEACYFYMPLVFLIGIVGILYTSIITLSQIDLKKIVAYSSIGHMNLVLIGIFSMSPEGLLGSIFLMIAHGFSSPALFMLVGSLYDRYHTRNLYYYGGLAQYMPLFSTFFLLFTFCSVGFPGTLGFLGEIFILFSCFKINKLYSIFLVISLYLVFVYSIWLLQRLCFGENYLLRGRSSPVRTFSDLNLREFLSLVPFFAMSVILGLFPGIFETLTGFLNFALNYGV